MIVVGLGNPGSQYAKTPHNVGFAVVDELAQRLSCRMRRSLRFSARVGKTAWEDRPLLLMAPETYMNRSGSAVGALLRYHRIVPADMIAVLDDADLAIGRIRIRPKGSSGGHRGLDSIVGEIGTADFPRVRIGIGRDDQGKGLVEHVLTPFSAEEWRAIEPIIQRAAEAVLCIVTSGIETAMNKYNGQAAAA